MTIPYNITIKGISNKLEEYFIQHFISTDIKNFIDLTPKFRLNKDQISNILQNNKYSESESFKGCLIHTPKKTILKNENSQIYFTNSEIFSLARLIQLTVHHAVPTFNNLDEYLIS
jgi:hypothetical protein